MFRGAILSLNYSNWSTQSGVHNPVHNPAYAATLAPGNLYVYDRARQAE